MTAETPPTKPPAADRRWACLLASAAMLLTLFPYLVGYAWSEGRRFQWLGYNLDDSCVYLSWMRQAADGSTRAYNLFTTEPQHGMMLNPLFLLMGNVARFTGLPLLAVYHASRMLFGFGLLLLVWEFLRLLFTQESEAETRSARRLAFLLVCFSSGLGWLPFWWDSPPLQTPIDKWQPEAITFLSLYLSPLFCFSMALQVGTLLLLFLGERAGRARYAVAAGVCGFVLGFVHSYDVISLSAVWLAYLLLKSFPAFRGSGAQSPLAASWLRALLAGAITAPAVLIIFQQYRTEAVFRARADVETLSPGLHWVLIGYGLILLLAVYGIVARFKASDASAPDADSRPALPTDAFLLLTVWAVANIAVSYLPGVAFQRKMLQGAHFPLAILAGIGAAALFSRILSKAQTPERPKSQPVSPALLTFLLILLLSATNIRFVVRDVANYAANRAQTMQQRPYLHPGEVEALQWIAANTPADAAIQPMPWVASIQKPDGGAQIGVFDTSVACFTPGLIRRKVYCGHWGETPDFGTKLNELARFALPTTSDAERIALLRRMKTRYLVFTQKATSDSNPITAEITDRMMPMFRGQSSLPPYLTVIHSNEDADVIAVSDSLF